MKIRIIRGIYGKQEGKRVVEKNENDPPFEVEEKEGNRLIMLGVAKEMISADGTESGFTVPEEDIREEESMEGEPLEEEDMEEAPEDYHVNSANLDQMSMEELRQLAAGMGLKKNGGKQELIKKIQEAMEEEDKELLELEPDDPD